MLDVHSHEHPGGTCSFVVIVLYSEKKNYNIKCNFTWRGFGSRPRTFEWKVHEKAHLFQMTTEEEAPQVTLTYRVVRWIMGKTLGVFFQEIDVVGKKNVPASGPVIFVGRCCGDNSRALLFDISCWNRKSS